LPQFGARPHRPDQRRDAENEGKGGHQDRPQPQVRRLDRGVEPVAPGLSHIPTVCPRSKLRLWNNFALL
jgi:hypothetical protein